MKKSLEHLFPILDLKMAIPKQIQFGFLFSLAPATKWHNKENHVPVCSAFSVRRSFVAEFGMFS